MKEKVLLFIMFFYGLHLSFGQAPKLDRLFGTNGIVTADLGERYDYSGTAKKVLLQSDRSIYLIIQIFGQTIISKRNLNGLADTSYGDKGFTSAEIIYTNDAILQPDGKIVLVGTTGEDFSVIRYNIDGTLDNTFSSDGKQTTNFVATNVDEAHAVAIQSDGKIVVVGETDYYSYFGTIDRIAIVRYNVDGSLDKSFSGDGIELDETFTFGTANSVAIQKDQKIVVATAGEENSDFHPFLVRYKPNGSLDSTFGNNGTESTIATGEAKSIAIQSDGKIVAMGSNFNVARFNTNGSLDNSFSKDGKQTTDFDGQTGSSNSLAIQSNGKIILSGYTGAYSNYNFALVRYNSNGSPDNSFSGDGKQVDDFESKNDIANSLALQTDGKIVVAGSAFIRYNTDGNLDNAFNKNGKLPTNVNSGYTVYTSSKIQKDEKIVVAGQTWNGSNFYSFLVRYNRNGSIDSTFSAVGIQQIELSLIEIANDGKIVVARGDTTLARYNTDGSPDHSFSKDGIQQNDFKIASIAIQNDGKIVVAGGSYDFTVARYNLDGSLDKSFSDDGKQTTIFYDPNEEDNGELEQVSSYASFIVIESNGKIAVIGRYEAFDQYNNSPRGVIAYYNTDGSLDSTSRFEIPNINSYTNGDLTGVAIGSNDKIVIVSNFDEHPYGENKHVVLIGSNFSRDLDLPFSYYSVAVQDDGKIILGGPVVARYNADGSIDSTFGNNGKQSPVVNVNSIAISENKLYAVGSLSNNGGVVGAAARYLLNNSSNTPPTVSLTTPTNNATYLAPAAHIKLSAAATDKDGAISKVEFYNGTTLLHTETVLPYGFVWRNVPLGNYILTAKATDNTGAVTTSAAVHISVVPNKAPAVSIIKPDNNQSFAAPGYIHFEAAASDVDGRITNVKFYNGSTLLRIEYQYPYTYAWLNVAAGTYTITAVATDNWGAHTASAPVTVRVTSPDAMIVSSRTLSANRKTSLNDAFGIRLSPNPVINTVNLYTKGLQQNKRLTVSILSVSGITVKMFETGSDARSIQLDVSSLASGVYMIKVVNAKDVFYKQFVKL
jgi:uncharacterized delta-60 repeat protein